MAEIGPLKGARQHPAHEPLQQPQYQPNHPSSSPTAQYCPSAAGSSPQHPEATKDDEDMEAPEDGSSQPSAAPSRPAVLMEEEDSGSRGSSGSGANEVAAPSHKRKREMEMEMEEVKEESPTPPRRSSRHLQAPATQPSSRSSRSSRAPPPSQRPARTTRAPEQEVLHQSRMTFPFELFELFLISLFR